MDLQSEVKAYQDGTYTMPFVPNFQPMGDINNEMGDCNGCNSRQPLTKWITHNVDRTPVNPDASGSFGQYTQVSRYCASCFEVIDPLVKALWKEEKHCTWRSTCIIN